MIVTARPSTGYEFEQWTGDVADVPDVTESILYVVMTDSKSITAVFVESSLKGYKIAVAVQPSGSGTITLSPKQTRYSKNDQVSITASAKEGYVFSHWEGDLTGTSQSTTLVVDGNKSIVAVFNPILTVQHTPSGGGTVEVIPSSSSGDYTPGTVVTLVARPSVGHVFSKWTGDVAGIADVTQSAVSIAMTGPRSITANFSASQVRHKVGVTVLPSGGGSVVLSPNQSDYTTNQLVSVTASPNDRYVFSHWQGDLTGTNPIMTLAMDRSKTITAVFNPLLTIQQMFSNGGVVEVNPPLTTNGYALGTVVSLTARPNTGYVFDKWTGDVAGVSDATQHTVNLVMDMPRNIAVNFIPIPLLKVMAGAKDDGSGVVTLDPAQSSEGYQINQEIKLYAVAAPGYVFSHWSGDASGSDPVITLTMDAEKNITAVFDPCITINCNPVAGGTVEFTGPASSGGYTMGTEITLQAVASEGYKFKSWSGDVKGNDGRMTITIDGPMEITAIFASKQTQVSWWLWSIFGAAGLLAVLVGVRLALLGSESKSGED